MTIEQLLNHFLQWDFVATGSAVGGVAWIIAEWVLVLGSIGYVVIVVISNIHRKWTEHNDS